MIRVFTWVAVAEGLVLIAAVVLGLGARSARLDEAGAPTPRTVAPRAVTPAEAAPGGTNPISRRRDPSRTVATVALAQTRHLAIVLFALLLACLMHTGVFTYFTVTGKLIQQALALGKLDRPDTMTAVQRTKTQATRWLGASIVAMIPAIATGARAFREPVDARWHLVWATLALVVHGLACVAYHRLIRTNADLLSQTMDAYQAVRADGRGVTRDRATI